jgi:hypothetical protein
MLNPPKRRMNHLFLCQVMSKLILFWVSRTLSANEQGFVQAGHCCLTRPELKPNKEVKDNNIKAKATYLIEIQITIIFYFQDGVS